VVSFSALFGYIPRLTFPYSPGARPPILIADHGKCQEKRRELAAKLAREIEDHEATKKESRELRHGLAKAGNTMKAMNEEIEALRKDAAYLRARLRNATRVKPYDQPQKPTEVIELD
jgi:chromosome segregation ATPase